MKPISLGAIPPVRTHFQRPILIGEDKGMFSRNGGLEDVVCEDGDDSQQTFSSNHIVLFSVHAHRATR